MKKNTTGQVVAFQMVSTTDGSAVTSGTPTVYVTIDGGSQGTGGGTKAHEGNGCWSYACDQADTNGTHVVFTMVLTGAVSQSVNVYPTASADQSGDSYALANGSTGFVAIDTVVDAIKAKTDNLPTDPADESAVEAAITAATSGLATAANLAVVAGYIDTEIQTIIGYVDCLPASWVVPGVGTSTLTTGDVDARLAAWGKTGFSLATAPPTAAEILAAIEGNGSKVDVIYDDWLNGGRLDLLLDAIKATTDKLDSIVEVIP